MYAHIVEAIYDRVDLAQFQLSSIGDLDIKFYPSDWEGKITGIPFFRVSVIVPQSNLSSFNAGQSINGLVILSYYEKKGKGAKPRSETFDLLDSFFVGQKLTQNLQTSTSYIVDKGTDRNDGQLNRTDYHLKFTYNGEI